MPSFKGLPPGTVVNGRVICGAKTRNDGRCQLSPVVGQKRCRFHGGIYSGSLAVVERNNLQARINKSLQKLGWEPVTDPATKIAELAGEVWAFKELCREQINELNRWDGVDDHNTEYVKALVVVYERSLDRTAKLLADMLRIGIDAAALGQAQTKPTRDQAQTLVTVIERTLASLNLTAEQKARVPEALISSLRGEGLVA